MQSAPVAPHKLTLAVVYNGVPKPLSYKPHEHGRVLFEHACHAFGIHEHERKELALFLPDNTTEVPLDVPLERPASSPTPP